MQTNPQTTLLNLFKFDRLKSKNAIPLPRMGIIIALNGDRSMIRCSPKTRRKALLRYRRSKRIVNHCVSSSGNPLFFDSLMQADFNCNFLKLIICGISYIYDDFYLIFPGKKYILQMIFHGIVLLWDMCYLTTVIFQQIR